MMTKIAKYTPIALLFIIVSAGFALRLYGIINNHSFWSDEAYVSSISREVAFGHISPVQGLKILNYQPLQILSTALFFMLFGISEFTARLPSAVMGTIGILFAYLLAKRLSTTAGGLLAAFIYAFLQLNLANSTQAKPYTLLQTLILVELWLISIIDSKKKHNALSLHLTVITIASIASLVHFLGIITWIPYLVYLGIEHRNVISTWSKKPKLLIGLVISLALAAWLFQVPTMVSLFFSKGLTLTPFNYLTDARELIWRQYGFIVLPAIVGLIVLYKTHRTMSIVISVLLGVYLHLATFEVFHFSVRYLVPFFGVTVVMFGAFWGLVENKLVGTKKGLVCLLIAILLFAGGYKIVRKPSHYYSPNADRYGDIQVANYKTMFSELKKQIPDYKTYAIFSDVVDAQQWYMKEKDYDALFVKGGTGNIVYGETDIHKDTGAPIYTTLKQFIDAKNKTDRGLLVVEDWESILPEDIKQYAKKNMELEFRIEGMPEAAGDNWPLEVYSWKTK